MDFDKISELIDKLIEVNSLSLHRDEETKKVYYIPYILNDAVEYYIKLNNVSLKGEYNNEVNITEYQLLRDDKGIIFTQENNNVFTVWFENFEIECNLYKYHHLGHFFRRGEDNWRRLNYVIGTMYDKYSYIGECACNETELRMMKLLGFVPFRSFSPIDDSFDIFYEQEELKALEEDGILLMQEIMQNTGVLSLEKMLQGYYKAFLSYKNNSIFINRFRYNYYIKKITAFMQTKECYPIYKWILDELDEGLKCYKDRIYEPERQHKHQQIRADIQKKMSASGYSGVYPRFYKDNESINFIEEHPYVIKEMEYDNFDFNVYGMKSVCKEAHECIDGGFFADSDNQNYYEIIDYCNLK